MEPARAATGAQGHTDEQSREEQAPNAQVELEAYMDELLDDISYDMWLAQLRSSPVGELGTWANLT
jgi:hypothetical protein